MGAGAVAAGRDELGVQRWTAFGQDVLEPASAKLVNSAPHVDAPRAGDDDVGHLGGELEIFGGGVVDGHNQRPGLGIGEER